MRFRRPGKTLRIYFLSNPGSVHTSRWMDFFGKRGHQAELQGLAAGEDETAWAVRVRREIREQKPDILHAHYVIKYGRAASSADFHPFVLTAWGSDVLVAPKQSEVIRSQANEALHKADVVTTQTEYMREYLLRNFGLPAVKVKRVPWGIDLATFRQGYEAEAEDFRRLLDIPAKGRVILSNRHVRPHYQAERIVAAVSTVLRSFPDAVFVFLRGIGEDIHWKALTNRVESSGITGNVRFVSRQISSREMAACLNLAEIFISIPKTDQFAASVLEGMACGTMPLVSDLEVYRQYLRDGENAVFAKTAEPEELADKIVFCLRHPGLRDVFSRRNRRIIAEKEDWDKNSRKMERLYRQLVR